MSVSQVATPWTSVLNGSSVGLGNEEKNAKTEAKSTTERKPPVHLRTRNLGVYELLEEVPPLRGLLPSWRVREIIESCRTDWPYLRRFAVECFYISPRLITLAILMSLTLSLIPALTFYLAGNLLAAVQDVVQKQTFSTDTLIRSVIPLLVARLLEEGIATINYRSTMVLEALFKSHFEQILLQARLRLDIPTLNDKIVQAKITLLTSPGSRDPWRMVDDIMQVVSSVVGMVSQLFVLFAFMRSENGGPMFAAVACIQPLLSITSSYRFPRACYVYISNMAYKRMRDVAKIVNSDTYLQDIIGNGLAGFLTEEYQQSLSALGETDTSDFWHQYYNPDDPIKRFISSLSPDLPVILCALQSIRTPGSVSLVSLTLLTTTSRDMSWRLIGILHDLKELADFRSYVVTLYEFLDTECHMKDGHLEYPMVSSDNSSNEAGMKIEFRNVSFAYPSDPAKLVARNLSFTVEPGQLCVIVGENGCGKSSTVKLLNRLYDVTEGAILIDNNPIESFVAADLRQAQAILYQDHTTSYPLTVRDSITLGDVHQRHNTDKIHRAAKSGGAYDFIMQLPKGFDTDIQSTKPYWSTNLNKAVDGGPLKERIKRMGDDVKISGGQWQRLAISRNFMRSMDNDNIRLLCFDEPSSALDPKAEFDLFEQLRNMKGKKTLVFITHRFGHLTKYADLILYMKDGVISESGTHEELLGVGGEYAQLYNVQAQAFT